MPKFILKQATEDDPIFKQGWILSSPNPTKRRQTNTGNTEGTDTKSADESIDLDNTKGGKNKIFITQNKTNKQEKSRIGLPFLQKI